MEVAGRTTGPPLLPEEDFLVLWLKSDTGRPAARARPSTEKSTGREKTTSTCQASLF